MAIALGTSATQLKVGAGTVSRVYKGSTAFWDSDAAAYTAAVEAADGQSLELGVVAAYHNFILGCKADGIWDAIKASCILCGARTLAGALVPLAGTAPTNVADGFVSGDYTRGGATPGLQGDGTSYLDSGFSDASVDTDNIHAAVYVSAFPTLSNTRYLGSGVTTAPSSSMQLQHFLSRHWTYNRSRGSYYDTGSRGLGLFGTSRDNSANYDVLSDGVLDSVSDASFSTDGTSFKVFGYASGTGITDAQIAFYSAGEALDLEALGTRVTTLITAIGNAL